MSAVAYYGTRRGGSGARSIRSASEAEALLHGRGGVTTVRIFNAKTGERIGERAPTDSADDRRIRWIWCYDAEALSAALREGGAL